MEKKTTVTTITVVTTENDSSNLSVTTSIEGDIQLDKTQLNNVGKLILRYGQANEIAKGIESLEKTDLFPTS